jgi:hypothetical protein
MPRFIVIAVARFRNGTHIRLNMNLPGNSAIING